MDRADLEQRLQGLGLSGHQARIYLRTLELGPLTGAQLAEKADVPRSKVYEVCKGLIDKGLLELESGVPRRFRAMPLARLLEQRKSQLSREAADLDRKHRELQGLLAQVVPRPEPAAGGLAVLQGEARVITHLRMMVRDAQGLIQVLLADGSLGMLGLVMEEKPRAAAVRVVHRLVAEDLPRVRHLTERGAVVRHGRAPIPITSVTVDGSHTLVLIHPQAGEAAASGLWSSEPSLVAAEEARFALAWKDATTLAKRQTEIALGRDLGTTELLKQEGGRAEGFAAFAAACVAALAEHGEPVDLALGAPFLAAAEDPRLRSLLAKHRTRLLLPFPRDQRARAVAESTLDLAEARHAPPWLGEQAMLIVDGTSLVASVDPATGHLETIIASGEPGLVRWLRRIYEVAWDAAGEPRAPREDRTAFWTFSRRAADAEAWLRHLAAVATEVVEVRGPPAAEAHIARLVDNPKVTVRRLPLPPEAQGSLLVGVDGRLLLMLEGARFARDASRIVEAVDAGVLTNSRTMLAFHAAAPAARGSDAQA